MWIRSAYWIGKPFAGQEAAFTAAINDELLPMLKRLPAVADALALWPRRLEDTPPGVACQILVHFNNEADIDRMLASPERQAMRERVKAIVPLFDGSISHIDFEVAG